MLRESRKLRHEITPKQLKIANGTINLCRMFPIDFTIIRNNKLHVGHPAPVIYYHPSFSFFIFCFMRRHHKGNLPLSHITIAYVSRV